MAEILKINGHDWSRLIESKGYGWSRNDLDSDKTTRTKDGKMRRDKICTKRKLTYTTLPSSKADLAALDDDLSAATFSATYIDLHGEMTRTFYCSSFATSMIEAVGARESWGSASFTLVEV